jgi:hypothetical protein
MPFPRQVEIEVPLLQALVELGGEGRPRDIYSLVAKRFPQLTPEEQEERLENYPSTRKWSNLVQWIRQRLVDLGQIDGSQRGIWKITAAGRARLQGEGASPLGTHHPQDSAASVAVPPVTSLRDLVNTNLQEIKTRLVSELRDLTPRAFEHFCKELLAHLGYRNVEVTRAAKTAASTATVISGREPSAFGRPFRPSDGPITRSEDRTSIDSAGPFRESTTTESFSLRAGSRRTRRRHRTRKERSQSSFLMALPLRTCWLSVDSESGNCRFSCSISMRSSSTLRTSRVAVAVLDRDRLTTGCIGRSAAEPEHYAAQIGV